MPPFFGNVITSLLTLAKMAPRASQWLDISVRIGTIMCSSVKYTSFVKPSSPGDLWGPTCFNPSQTLHSETKPSQLAASANRRGGGRLNSYETPEPERQDSEQSDQGNAPERPRTSPDLTRARAHPGT